MSVVLESLECFINSAVAGKVLREMLDDCAINLECTQGEHQLRFDNVKLSVALSFGLLNDALQAGDLIIQSFPFLLEKRPKLFIYLNQTRYLLLVFALLVF